MTEAEKTDDSCPFCKTVINNGATVCTGCGARRGTRGDASSASGVFGRFIIWCNTIGVVLAITLVGAADQYRKDHIVFALAIVAFGFGVLKVANKVWRAIFGSLSDPVWVRQ